MERVLRELELRLVVVRDCYETGRQPQMYTDLDALVRSAMELREWCRKQAARGGRR